MRLRNLFSTSVASLVLAGCAAKPRPSVAMNEPVGQRWTGNLQPTQQRSGTLAVTGQNRAFGSVQITNRNEGGLQRMHVALTVAVPTESSSSLRWAVLPERCGSGDLPLIGFEQFPLIELGTNGRGQVEADLPLVLAQNSAYHVNVYKGGQQLDNVITCANLKFEPGAAR